MAKEPNLISTLKTFPASLNWYLVFAVALLIYYGLIFSGFTSKIDSSNLKFIALFIIQIVNLMLILTSMDLVSKKKKGAIGWTISSLVSGVLLNTLFLWMNSQVSNDSSITIIMLFLMVVQIGYIFEFLISDDIKRALK